MNTLQSTVTAISVAGLLASGPAMARFAGQQVCYEERDSTDIVLVLNVKLDGSLTTWRDVYNGALPQRTFSAIGKLVTDTNYQSTDGGVLVGGDDEGAYMDLHAYKLSLSCGSDQASPTPNTWTCSLATDGGTETSPVRFDRVANKDNLLCTSFVIPDIPDPSIPTPAPTPPSGPPTPETPPPVATCSQCNGLKCLLSDGNPKTCPNVGEDLCFTRVDDSGTGGREIERGCAASDAVIPEVPSDTCKSVEGRVTSAECVFYCDGITASGCNNPPGLIPVKGRVPEF